MFYAHSRNAQGQRHDLIAHLQSVSDMATSFADAFGAGEIARLIGLWHDLGKFNPQFQAYLLACEADPDRRGHGPDHKAAGTQLALQHLSLAALLIQGHHGGLRTRTGLQTWLAERTSDPAVTEALRLAQCNMPDLEPKNTVSLPAYIRRDAKAAEFFLRMLFSALVDADYLDTERHFSGDKALHRGVDATMADLWSRFEAYHKGMSGQQGGGPVSDVRRRVYEACVRAADLPPGLFRLAVPTGGGKTLSGMAFALRHALRHDLRRVIVAVPFISITEQTADVYRGIFGAARGDDTRPIVLEHHSGTIAESPDSINMWARLAAENWDAPIVVTTTVQLLESLFANGTAPCRKNHRLTRSIIILDEAQALPSHLLTPILSALQQLRNHFGATVVISTATQPAFEAIPSFAALATTGIVPDSAGLFDALRRVDYEWRINPALDWPDVASLVTEAPAALAVLNTKKDALAVLDALADPDALHLSTLLCGAHRRHVIREVKKRLDAGAPCRLVATQVIEAGVDLDFPLVLRALGPLDGIIQAAGRCNREGYLRRGRVIVFQPAQGGTPKGSYSAATGITRALVGQGAIDPDDPGTSRTYFEQLFQTVETDREGIQKLREEFDYPEVARRFRMIADDTESVCVAYGSSEEQARTRRLLERLRYDQAHARLLLRQLQPYLVSVRSREAERYRRQGWMSPVIPGVGEWMGRYDPVRGLMAEDMDADTLVV